MIIKSLILLAFFIPIVAALGMMVYAAVVCYQLKRWYLMATFSTITIGLTYFFYPFLKTLLDYAIMMYNTWIF